MPKHIHADLIHQWADGDEIQYKQVGFVAWTDACPPRWYPDVTYRIKPKPKTIKYKRYLGKRFYSEGFIYFIGISRFDGLVFDADVLIVHEIDTEWQEVQIPE